MKIRVTFTHVRKVPVFKYEVDLKTGLYEKTKTIIRTDSISKSQVLFSGTETAFNIWKKGHLLPEGSKVETFKGEARKHWFLPKDSIIFPREAAA